MRMTTKGRFALNALVDVALRESAGPVALAAIGRRQGVSLSYLEQMFSRLRRVGIVESTRGPGGGYTLGRSAALISVADVVRAVDDADDTPRGDGENPTESLWPRLNAVMLEHMATISLASLVEEQLARGAQMAVRPVPPAPVSERARMPLARPVPPNSVFSFGRSLAAVS